jgi:hypothetical protein
MAHERCKLRGHRRPPTRGRTFTSDQDLCELARTLCAAYTISRKGWSAMKRPLIMALVLGCTGPAFEPKPYELSGGASVRFVAPFEVHSEDDFRSSCIIWVNSSMSGIHV